MLKTIINVICLSFSLILLELNNFLSVSYIFFNMLKTITSVVCLSFTFILLSNIDPTQLAEIGLTLLEECLREMKIEEKDIKDLDSMKLGRLFERMNSKYMIAQYLAKSLSCAVNIRYYIETFAKHFLQVPKGFHARQTKINTNLNVTVYNRSFDLGNLVKDFVKFRANTTHQDKETFKPLSTKLKEFEIYYPPEGRYDAIIPIKNERSENLKNLLINLNTAENSEKAWASWTQDREDWGKITNHHRLSDPENHTLLELSLLSGNKLSDFITLNGLVGRERNYVIGMIEAGESIREKFVDKKYNFCFWTMYYSSDDGLPAFKESLKKKWNLSLESQVVNKFCQKMIILFDIVSGVDMKLIPWACQPDDDDYKAYINRISKKDSELVPVVQFLVGINYKGESAIKSSIEKSGPTFLQSNNKDNNNAGGS